ncbi:SbcC/MukB-like Walker B domain-containing protein [Streptomyces sp. NBC_00273]|uniref:SbcC/MukB-like Walker B domain-containing protein n=1 Tax=Streptomyces sp. NBC_00273 TaxID=2903644 RepID=UPI002E290BAA|nr:SbcC/MukB-like Walker B domain-containing protein [Streptomyces sp. NBC_00273]
MSDTPRHRHLADAAGPFTDVPTLDPHPTARGRWQPTRAGAVNSWLWTNEQFAYANGSLALVGMNGSGKSLTSAVLFPTFIDGNVTAKNLSAAAEAAGTLTAIHTLGRPGPPKSGTWWQEYGRTDPDGQHTGTRWLTAGLWLHSGGGQRNSLDRAWFLVPARVHAQLILERDGMPVTITDLAAQLAAFDGLLFTSSPRLEQQCRDHPSVLRKEEDYPETVRELMYQPLDGTQTDALATVLRALRSVQAGDKISPRIMEETLTSALPALETRRVQSLAEALSKAEQLQGHLKAAHTERGILSDIRGSYRRYLAAAATTTATAYETVHTLHADTVTARAQALRAETDAKQRQDEATAALQEDEERAELLRDTVRSLENRIAEHPGTNLADLSHQAQECEDRATDSLQYAEQAGANCQERLAQSAADQQTADRALAAWAKTTHDLGALARDLGAAAFHEPLARALGGTRQHPDSADNGTAVAAREQAAAWGQAQSQAAERVQAALDHFTHEQDKHSTAQETYENKRQHAEAADARAQDATDALEQAEEVTRAALSHYSTHLKRLPALPDDLYNVTPLDPAAICTWVSDQAADALTKLGVRACQERADARSQAADEASERAAAASELAANAAQQAMSIADGLSDKADALTDTPSSLRDLVHAARQAARIASPRPNSTTHTQPGEQEEHLLDTLVETAHSDLSRRRLLIQQAARDLTDAARAQDRASTTRTQAQLAQALADTAEATAHDARSSADQEAHTWARHVHEWAHNLKVLDPASLRLPDLAGVPLDLNAAHHLAQDAATAHRSAVEVLSGRLAEAELRLNADRASLENLDEKIRHAQQGSTPPTPPDWRDSRHGRAGTPLWEAVEFAQHLQPDEASQLEGALLAAGLLDAWISPTGELAAGDTTLALTPEHQGPSLADVLVPDSHTPVDPALVRRLLAGIRLLQPGERPLPGQAAVCVDGTAYIGPLTATSPATWDACHIGAAARERARQQLLTDLNEKRHHAATVLSASRTLVDTLKHDLINADREQASPDPTPWRSAEEAASNSVFEANAKNSAAIDAARTAAAAEEDRQSTSRTAQQTCAKASLTMSQQAAEAALTLCTELTGQITTTTVATKSAITTTRTLHAANEHAAKAQAEAVQAHHALNQARQAAHETEEDQRNLPNELNLVRPAQEAADRAHRRAQETAKEATSAEEALGRQTHLLSGSASRLHAQAHNAFAQLPVEPEALGRYRSRLQTLVASLSGWGDAALRAQFTAQTAADSLRHAAAAQAQADRLRRRANDDQRAADRARHRHDEEVRQHQRPYQQLSVELEQRLKEQSDLHTHLAARRNADHQARLDHSRKGDESQSCATRLAAATQDRAAALTQLQALFDHGLIAELPDNESLHRPEQPGEALDIARAVLEQRGLGNAPTRAQASTAESEARTQLDRRIRYNLNRLLEINRHVVSEDIPGTTWRRITVTHLGHASETGTAQPHIQPLSAILDSLTHTITKLENDFSEQVQNEVKGVVFSELRRDINTRIHTAQGIVDDITRTLDGVRTGVANVGIRLQWLPKKDPVAAKALQLIQAADLTGNFDRMYDFFIEQLKNEEANYPTWAKRVEHVFNYRNWFTWEIALTHNDFRDDPSSDTEVFRTLTTRNNPLASLSGGEKRLVTMLPLLAAAHAFYATEDYEGPHMVFIDELDAALDSNNLRKLLELLRTWDLDAVVTLPSMRPLLVAETQSIGIHRIHKTRTARYTIPSIWTGAGTPHTTRICASVPTPRTHDQSETEGSV